MATFVIILPRKLGCRKSSSPTVNFFVIFAVSKDDTSCFQNLTNCLASDSMTESVERNFNHLFHKCYDMFKQFLEPKYFGQHLVPVLSLLGPENLKKWIYDTARNSATILSNVCNDITCFYITWNQKALC